MGITGSLVAVARQLEVKFSTSPAPPLQRATKIEFQPPAPAKSLQRAYNDHRGILMPLVTIKPRNSDHDFDNPFSKLPLILEGVIFICVAIFATARHDPSRAMAWLSIGAGMMLYGVTDILLRRTRWRIPALLGALAFWFGSVFLALNVGI